MIERAMERADLTNFRRSAVAFPAVDLLPLLICSRR